MWTVIVLVTLISCHAVFSGKSFKLLMSAVSLGHCCGEILTISSLQNNFRASALAVWRLREHEQPVKHGISVMFAIRLWQGHFKMEILLLLSHSETYLFLCFGLFFLFSCCTTQLHLSLNWQEWWPDVLLQDFLSENRIYVSLKYHPGPEAAKHSHTASSVLDWKYNTLLCLCFVEFSVWFSAHVTVVPSFQEVRIFYQKVGSWEWFRLQHSHIHVYFALHPGYWCHRPVASTLHGSFVTCWTGCGHALGGILEVWLLLTRLDIIPSV